MDRYLFPELLEAAPSYSTGLLPSQRLEKLVHDGVIFAAEAISPDQIQPASIDLRLGGVAYEVPASFLPSPRITVSSKAELLGGVTRKLDLEEGAILERGRVYIIPLQESLRLPLEYWGRSNPKSTTGRLDVLARLVTDYGSEFDKVEAGYRGPLYVEIVPRTFRIRVRAGSKLNQLRIVRGSPPATDSKLVALQDEHSLVFAPDGSPLDAVIKSGLRLSVELAEFESDMPIGYKAKRVRKAIDFDRIGHYSAREFWDFVFPTPERRLILEPEQFYILASKQLVRVPANFAAEMVAFDPSFGEFRVHYAGFFDPGFGDGGDIAGARAVLEVRSHGVPFLLDDSQTVGRLVYERLMAPAMRRYGRKIGSQYQGQSLALSKQFAPVS